MEPYRIRMCVQQELDGNRLHSRPKTVSLRCITEELEDMQSNPSDDFKCLALKSNPYDWQFAIRGPNGTEFEGGIYHGRIQFSEEYPHKPPIFTLLTENGRFKTKTELDFWGQTWPWPKYCVRDALLRLIESLTTYPDGKLGSVEYDKGERRALAIKSRVAAPIYGTKERQDLMNKIHECMLSMTPPVPSNGGADIRVSSQNDRDKGKQGKRIYIFGNTIKSKYSKQAGVFGFDRTKKRLHLRAEKKRKTNT